MFPQPIEADISANDSRFGLEALINDDMADLLRVLDEVDYGIILLDGGGRIRHANHVARFELSRGVFLASGGDRLVIRDAAKGGELERAIALASAGRRQLVTLESAQAEQLSVACLPLRSPFESDVPPVLLMLSKRAKHNLNVSLYAKNHGLSAAEENVLRGLCEGYSVQGIAERHGVAESTVRTQIRAVREKTRLPSIRLLVQQVASLPPVVPALRHLF